MPEEEVEKIRNFGKTSAKELKNKLIEMGVADPDRLGVHGTSYGGYATLMAMARYGALEAEQRATFAALRELRDRAEVRRRDAGESQDELREALAIPGHLEIPLVLALVAMVGISAVALGA